jgi:hypothetical protein
MTGPTGPTGSTGATGPTGEATLTRYRYTAVGGETGVSGADDNSLTLSYTAGKEQVFYNGVLLVRGLDYTASNGTSITSLAALTASDVIEVLAIGTFNIADGILATTIDAKGDLLVGTANDTVARFAVGTDGQYLKANSGVTGGLQWADVAGALAQPTEPSSPSDGQIWIDTDGTAPTTVVTRWTEQPAAGTTVLTGNDDYSIPLAYSPGYEQVFLNGVLLSRSGSEYTATNGTSITLAAATVAGDIVEVICPLQIATTDTYTQSAVNNAFQANTNNFAAGKNHLINGDFSVNQRAFTSTTSSGAYGFDRWYVAASDGTTTYSSQNFTAGAAPVAGYESATFARIVSTGQTSTSAYSALSQKIEDVRTLANQNATISFWAKASSGTPKVAVELVQSFGSGGSPSSDVLIYVGQSTLSTSWARYSITVSVPSLSGKTVGSTANTSFLGLNLFTSAGSALASRTGSLGIQSTTIDTWGVQVEAGSTATAFQTATGTIQGELAACQRYYIRWANSAVGNATIGMGLASNTTAANINITYPVTMRTAPTTMDYSNLRLDDSISAFTSGTPALESTYATNDKVARIVWSSTSGLTSFRPYFLSQNTSAGYLGLSAEL